MTRPPLFVLILALAVSGCGKPDAVDAGAARTAAALPDVNASAPTSIGEPHVATSPARPLPTPAATIPAALQGRWGLAPADCTSNRADAKGLLVLSAGGLRFNESQAVPASDVQADAVSIAGNFAFNGEGRSWTKYESIKIDKHVLVRTEINPTASFTYAKCG